MSLFKHNQHVIPGWEAGGLACFCSCFSVSRAWDETQLLHQSCFLRDFRAPTRRIGSFSGESLCVTIHSDTDISYLVLHGDKAYSASGSSLSPSLYLRVKGKAWSKEVLQMCTLEILF